MGAGGLTLISTHGHGKSLLVLEHLSAGPVGGVEEPLSMLRCINCGFRLDSLIEVHRDQHDREMSGTV